jgi:hypothetical protein
VENRIVLSEPCDSMEDAITIAIEWQPRMQAEGWRRVAPSRLSARPT